MEPIKITDRLTLRQEALRMAIDIHANILKGSAEVFDTAVKCANYMQMNADLPEYVDPNKDLKEMMLKLQDNFKLNPWISADSEMKPPKEKDVLCIEGEDVYVARFDGTGWYSSETVKAIEPTHWMPKPMPPFTQPTKL